MISPSEQAPDSTTGSNLCPDLAGEHSQALSGYTVKWIDGRFVVAVPVLIEIPVEEEDASDGAAAVICAAERLRDLELAGQLGGVPLEISVPN